MNHIRPSHTLKRESLLPSYFVDTSEDSPLPVSVSLPDTGKSLLPIVSLCDLFPIQNTTIGHPKRPLMPILRRQLVTLCPKKNPSKIYRCPIPTTLGELLVLTVTTLPMFKRPI